jgi:hypothetical protein
VKDLLLSHKEEFNSEMCCKGFLPPTAGEQIGDILDQQAIERLRHAGFAIVPLQPNDEMIKVGGPFCFSVPSGTLDASYSDAADCYRAMVELGCL